MRLQKLLARARRNPSGLRFKELCKLAEAFGFTFQRQRGSHAIYAHDGVRQIMSFQDDNGKAKAYQVRQLLDCADRHGIALGASKND